MHIKWSKSQFVLVQKCTASPNICFIVLENTEEQSKYGHSRETANIWYTRRTQKKTKKQHNMVGRHYAQTDTKNVNITWALLHTNGSPIYDFIYVCILDSYPNNDTTTIINVNPRWNGKNSMYIDIIFNFVGDMTLIPTQYLNKTNQTINLSTWNR